MSGGDWSVRDTIIVGLFGLFAVVVLAGAIFATGYSKAAHRIEAQNYASQYPADTNERIAACPTESVVALRKCIEEVVASAREDQRSEQDLNAQRDMAEWAWWLLVISFATLIVSGFGLLALLKTINQGQEANDIARTAFIGELRPWVDVEVVSVSMSAKSDTFELDVDFKVTNRGKTPALKVETRARIINRRGKSISQEGAFSPGEEYTKITQNLLPGGVGEDSVMCILENPEMTKIEGRDSAGNKFTIGPNFTPTLQLQSTYLWGEPVRTGVTIKNFAVSAVPPDILKRHYRPRLVYPISLDKRPVPQLVARESSIAEIT